MDWAFSFFFFLGLEILKESKEDAPFQFNFDCCPHTCFSEMRKCLLWLGDSYIAIAPRTKGVKILKTTPQEIEQNL